jgi:prolipoprotein diacylglyceryltransferase
MFNGNKYLVYIFSTGTIGIVISSLQKLSGNTLYYYGMIASLILVFYSILILAIQYKKNTTLK